MQCNGDADDDDDDDDDDGNDCDDDDDIDDVLAYRLPACSSCPSLCSAMMKIMLWRRQGSAIHGVGKSLRS